MVTWFIVGLRKLVYCLIFCSRVSRNNDLAGSISLQTDWISIQNPSMLWTKKSIFNIEREFHRKFHRFSWLLYWATCFSIICFLAVEKVEIFSNNIIIVSILSVTFLFLSKTWSTSHLLSKKQRKLNLQFYKNWSFQSRNTGLKGARPESGVSPKPFWQIFCLSCFSVWTFKFFRHSVSNFYTRTEFKFCFEDQHCLDGFYFKNLHIMYTLGCHILTLICSNDF